MWMPKWFRAIIWGFMPIPSCTSRSLQFFIGRNFKCEASVYIVLARRRQTGMKKVLGC